VGREEEAIRDVSSRWLELAQAQDAAGVASLFAEDGVVHWEDHPPTSGREAIQAFMARDFAENPSSEGGFAPDRIDVAASGDLAVEHGAFQGPYNEGRYLTVYRKVGGEWKVQADMSLGTSPDGGAPAWARQSLAQWYERFNARDAEGLADLYAPDARVGDVWGRVAIIQRFRAGWAESDASCSGAYDDFLVVGDLATGHGRDTCVVPGEGGGPAETMLSRWIAVYERQADGSWLCIRDRGEEVGS
jgi:uncharacterized protein (TIGR02246 family)